LAVVTEPAAPAAGLTGSDAAQVGRLREFVAAHGGAGTAVISYLGRVGARIVVVAEDGAFGDALATSVEAGAEICRQAAIPVADGWNRELSAKITPSAEDRRRMAGTGR
jgi:hypothetical protein